MTTSSDRGWMYKRLDSLGYLCLQYVSKVEHFLDFAYLNEATVENKLTREGGIVRRIKCPCINCKNTYYRTRDDVLHHLISRGFIKGYETWYEHGETKVQDVGQCSTSMEVDDEQYDGMTRMVFENMCAAGINPTFQSIPESSTMEEQQEEHVPNTKAKRFYEMLESSDEPLYNGCEDWSKLQAATSLLNWKSDCNVPTSTFNLILPILKSMLPNGNKLPSNFYETKDILKELNLPKKRIDVCKNHCMLFDKDEDLSLTHCRYCKEPRYKKNKVLNLVMTYMPIGPRIQRLYMSKKTAKDMIWHFDKKTKDGSMVHPRDGLAWKHFDEKHPLFANEIRNVRLGLCTDGFSPNNSNSNPYSLWPVFLTIYNLPPWMSLKDSYVKLCLIIPGRKCPGQNLDVFLQPLIRELKELWDVGLETYDANKKQNFMMRAMLLWTVSDFPAYAMLSGWSTHGRLACPHCMGTTHSFQLNSGGKPCWFDCHRSLLPEGHPFRRDKKGFKKGVSQVSSSIPPEFTGEDILDEVFDIPTVYRGHPYSAKNPKPDGFGVTHNWVKKSIFWELPYWHTLLIRHNLDVMHIEKNVFENLFHTVMDTRKTKDNIKARKDIEMYCDRPTLHTYLGNNDKVMKPKASYSLTKPQLQKVCDWLKKVKFPNGYASNIGACVNANDCTFYSFKSHDCHVFMQRLLPIALRGMIPEAIWDAITELCTFFRVICSRVLHIEDLQNLEKSIIVTICKLEKFFPPGFFDSMEHLVVHLAREAIYGGPVQYRWMYLYERKLGFLKRTVRNNARVEGSIVESYLVHELSTYCSLHLESTIQTRLNREPRNFAPEIPSSSTTDSRLSIFKFPSRRLYEKSGKERMLSALERHKVHTYILLNTNEVRDMIWKFDEWVRETEPNIEDEELDKKRETSFAKWFEKEVMLSSCVDEHLKVLAFGPLNKVKSYNCYFVNGYKFHTVTHCDGRVTQNSVVCVKGATYDEHESDYYGLLEGILEVEYHHASERCVVVMFKCHWFDPFRGVRVNRKHNMVDVKQKSKGCIDDPFIIASQAEQVYYTPYPSTTRDFKDWSAVVKTKARGIYELAERATQVDDENVEKEQFYQENERLTCMTNTNDDMGPVCLEQGEIEAIGNNTNEDDFDGGEDGAEVDMYISESRIVMLSYRISIFLTNWYHGGT